MAHHNPVILLVDDDLDFLDMTRSVLEANGYKVQCAQDSVAALEQALKQKPDLIITDLMMDSVDAGFSFARRVRDDALLGRVPMVIVTSASSRLGFDFRPRSPADLAAMKLDAYLDKPVSPDVLLAKVAELLKPDPKEPGA